MTGTNPRTGEQEIRRPDPKDPFCALAFKIVTDPFVGKLAISPALHSGMSLRSLACNCTRRPTRSRWSRVELYAYEPVFRCRSTRE